jgi:hypothetical protein
MANTLSTDDLVTDLTLDDVVHNPYNPIEHEFIEIKDNKETRIPIDFEFVFLPSMRKIKCHKKVIAKSEILCLMLEHEMTEKISSISYCFDNEEDFDTFNEMITYLYKNQFDNIHTMSLLFLADKYEIPDLKEKCSKMITANYLNKANALTLWYQFRQLKQFREMRMHCELAVKRHIKKILEEEATYTLGYAAFVDFIQTFCLHEVVSFSY